ncbi:MAG: histidine kinase [Frankiales bacterium]|nr:histidine kinase [Frankiales bacterium]
MSGAVQVPAQGPDVLVAVGEVIDLTNCEREPIRVPGSIQPHGVLLTVENAQAPVSQVSANIGSLTGLRPDQVLGTTLDTLFTPGTVSRITAAIAGAHPQTAATGIQQQIRVRVRLGGPVLLDSRPGDLDGLLHRSGPDWVLEVEPYASPITVENTYHAVRSVVTALNRTMDTAAMFEITVRQIRALTGFDRVMLYRFDRDWNGEVCAEDKREDLESFRGLHYPAGDIPPQARALYTVNWLRFIHDVDAVNAPLVPVMQPTTGQPLDLSFASLRSVSPVHCEYLRNMGVTASMSVSLVIDGQLAGLIACHHYSGPYVPPPAVRATCEFLAQTLSLLVAAREHVARNERAGLVTQVLARLDAATSASRRPMATALTEHASALLEVLGAVGVAWTLDGVTRTYGSVPAPDDVRRVRDWGRRHAVDGLATTESLGQDGPGLQGLAASASGVAVLVVSDDQDVVFFRPETAHTIDWGGNPHLKNLVTEADGTSRLSPRGSFKLWRENVLGRSSPWEALQLEAAEALRLYLVQHMLRHARDLAGVAETLARSLLPEWLPQPAGWALAADSRPASTGIGGDWYDAFVVASGELLLVVGDVAGHGLHAATAMAHLRNALRAYAFEDAHPPRLLARLDRLASLQTDDILTTVVVALLDPRTGRLHLASAGHPPPLLRRRDGSTDHVVLDARPPLGLGYVTEDEHEGSAVLTLQRGDAVALFSDGVVERRGESIERGLVRLQELMQTEVTAGADAGAAVRLLVAAAQPEVSEDDTTLMLLVRDDVSTG